MPTNIRTNQGRPRGKARIRMWLAAAGAAMAIGGCAGKPRVVELPVPVACVAPGEVPPEVPPAGPLPEDARAAADLLGTVVLSLRASDRLLRAIVKGCGGAPLVGADGLEPPTLSV